jgi:hypothetical protein
MRDRKFPTSFEIFDPKDRPEMPRENLNQAHVNGGLEHELDAANVQLFKSLDIEEANESNGFILRWTEKSPTASCSLFIRRIFATGKFYGSANIRTTNGNRGCTVVGCLTRQELEEVWKLIEQIKAQPERNLDGPNSGTLAEWPMTNPTIIHRRSLDTSGKPADIAFDRITHVIKGRILFDAPNFFS